LPLHQPVSWPPSSKEYDWCDRAKEQTDHGYSTEANPSDLATVCGVDASKVEAQITKLCGNNADAAMTAFTSVCKAAGKTVRTLPYKQTLSH